MLPYFKDDLTTVFHGDCIEVMDELPENSVDAIVTDPPYGLGFMGKKWDALPPGEEWAEACLRVLKPGGHILAFGGSRTWHRLAVAVEDGGFEIRDSVAWLYGSGFPKSGAQLKPAFEPIVVGRKPFRGSMRDNIVEHGVGGLNIDDNRIPGGVPSVPQPSYGVSEGVTGFGSGTGRNGVMSSAVGGRWPANVVLDEGMAEVLDQQSGQIPGRVGMQKHGSGTNNIYGRVNRPELSTAKGGTLDYGGASRFFYVAKAPQRERPNVDGVAHPTVKPLSLMRHLIRLVTPDGGTVLDSFAGSGTTLEAAMLEGYQSIGIELTEEYLPLIQHRIERAKE